MMTSPLKTHWLQDARLGTFVHFGPYAQYGRGEQVLVREYLEQDAYAKRAMQWRTPRLDMRQWADVFKRGGSRYAVLTTRHMDGFCLWGTKTTNYNSTKAAAQRDFVREFVEAMRGAGLKVGLYYSLADFRLPAYFAGPKKDPVGFGEMLDYNFAQVSELVSGYGPIDLLWFDAANPYSAEDWGSAKLIKHIRAMQPNIIVNDRLGAWRKDMRPGWNPCTNFSDALSDYNTCEQKVIQYVRPWEACDTSTWELWGYARGEHWKSSAEVVDLLCKVTSKNGTLLLNVGPKPDGSLPHEYVRLTHQLGAWLKVNGEAIYGAGSGGFHEGGLIEFNTHGWQTVKGKTLYCILRFWDGESNLVLRGIATKVTKVTLLGVKRVIHLSQQKEIITVKGLPKRFAGMGFGVLRLDFADKPKVVGMYRERLWHGNYSRMLPWARARTHGERFFDIPTSKSTR